MLSAAASTQTGAALGAHAFGAIGPAGVVAVRQLVAAALLLPLARPDVRRLRWPQWWPTLVLAAVFAAMNLSLYAAVDRIGLALAVTLEFLGPLAVALGGSRNLRDLVTAVAVGAGVYVLVLPGPTSDYLGVALGLLAATCWATYILTNRMVGARLPGVVGTALATSISALGYLPVLAVLAAQGRLTLAVTAFAVAAGALASALPYAVDLIVLRSVSPRVFGVTMSAHPVLAALAGMVLLRQTPAGHEWAGMAVIVAANVVTVMSRRATSP
jgi:inner membrane transporter RhtA